MKIILCRPQGGLNDKLSQIELCCQYARVNNRIVIVDTLYPSETSFFEEFSQFFISKESNLIFDSIQFKNELEGMEVYPGVLKGRLFSYDGVYTTHTNFIDTASGHKLSFDFDRSYDEQLLVHHQAGGFPERALNFFSRISLKKNLKIGLNQRLLLLGNHFKAAHIRNTDMQTDYMAAINFLNSQNITNLYLATDSQIVIEEMRKFFNNNFFTFTELGNSIGFPVHKFSHNVNLHMRNKDSILDLFTLALADELYIFKVKNNIHYEYSGYSMLADLLHNRKFLIRDMLLDN